ncbi:MAG: Lrp/AsnC family transcriptional regulator [Candidatus Thorarchaeota archaeon]|nr:Lrp/AsnC family transcriptional regulator [Candidatus Thorarchaeota archaeon]
MDQKLISILQKDARLAFTTIAKELNQPDTTIHFRTRRLRESGVVTRFSALVAPSALGYYSSALVSITIGGHILPDISRERTVTFAQELASKEEYLWVAVGAAPTTIHALLMGNDAEDLEQRVNALRRSPDVTGVTVTGIAEVVKGWEISGSVRDVR